MARREGRRCDDRRRLAVSHPLRWRVLVVLSLAAMVLTVIVGALAIMRARNDLES
jgi:hypothetical protein